jgi:Uma2 family endonuclease
LPDDKIAVGIEVCWRGHDVEAELQRRRFTADEYHRMAEAGILLADDRVELVDGEIVEMMPIGSRHAACVDRLNSVLQRVLAGRGTVRVHGPVRLDAHSEPQPDLSVLRSRADFYASAHPLPDDVILVVEVADASLRYDRDIKVRLYARAGIQETWLLDLPHERLDVFTNPTPQGYRVSRQLQRGERLTSEALPGASLLVDDMLGDIPA